MDGKFELVVIGANGKRYHVSYKAPRQAHIECGGNIYPAPPITRTGRAIRNYIRRYKNESEEQS